MPLAERIRGEVTEEEGLASLPLPPAPLSPPILLCSFHESVGRRGMK